MPNRTHLQRAIADLVAEIRDGFEPAPERISTVIPQRLLTDWDWSPKRTSIAGSAGWLHVTGEVLAVDPGQEWALAVDGFYWLQAEDYRVVFRRLAELPRPDVDVGPVSGWTADLSDKEIEALLVARTPPEHDYPYDDEVD